MLADIDIWYEVPIDEEDPYGALLATEIAQGLASTPADDAPERLADYRERCRRRRISSQQTIPLSPPP